MKNVKLTSKQRNKHDDTILPMKLAQFFFFFFMAVRLASILQNRGPSTPSAGMGRYNPSGKHFGNVCEEP